MSGQDRQIRLDADGHVRVAPALRNRIVGLVVVYVLFVLVFSVRFWQPDRVVFPGDNVQVAEAKAWLSGTLSLPERQWDTAEYEGRAYSHFPPAMTFLSAAVLPWSPQGVPFNLLAVLFVLPIPGLAYLLFLRRCDTVWGAAVMTCAFVLGTSELMVLRRTMQSGKVWQLNHAISQLGMLLFLIDYYGRRRGFLAGAGLLLATWSRLTLAVYLIPFVVMGLLGERRRTWTAWLGVGMVSVAIFAVPLTLNGLKFGHPLRPGYPMVYEGRDDLLARDARIGLFSPRFIARNLYAMNLGPPVIKEFRDGRRLVPNTDETGIWWTTPLLLYLILDVRRIWRSPHGRPLLSAVGVVYAALMMYHATGATQYGYNRYSLDFMLPLLAMIAPFAFEGKRRYVTVVLVAWSVAYFGWWIM